MGGWGDDEDVVDPATLAEAEGGRRQAELMLKLVRKAVASPSPLCLTPTLICDLHEVATRGLIPRAGIYRDGPVTIDGSAHVPPPHEEVPGLVVDLCEYVNGTTGREYSLHVAAYVLWRLCWIHPFQDGNGRTARAASYLMLSVRSELELPGRILIPERLMKAPLCYRRALEAADQKWAEGLRNVSEMQKLLGWYLPAQINDEPPGLPPWA